MPHPDPYAASATVYDLVSLPYARERELALAELIPRLRPEVGPVLDVGAGSCTSAEFILERVPAARILALEPSAAMRALAISRIAGHPRWFPRITVRPEDFFSAALPERIGGAVLLGVANHFDAGEFAAVLAELAARLPSGGAALIDLQAPTRPCRIEPVAFTVAAVGAITYRGITEAHPTGTETMRWRMTYLTLDGERVLTEDTAEFDTRHPSPEHFAEAVAEAGLVASALDLDPDPAAAGSTGEAGAAGIRAAEALAPARFILEKP